MSRAFTRRVFLGAAGLAALTYPSLRSSGRAIAQSMGAPPKRLVIWFTPCGTVEASFRATGGETDFVLPEILQPLEPYRSKLMLFGPNMPEDPNRGVRTERGLSIEASNERPSGGHQTDLILSGTPAATFDGVRWAGGPSVDQVVAQRIGMDSPLRSLELGIRSSVADAESTNRLNYAAAGEPIPVENDPLAAFRRLFGSASGTADEQARFRARRQSVLDAVYGDFAAMRSRASSDDRVRIDAHLAAIREVELSVERVATTAAMCTAPTMPNIVPGSDPDMDMPAIAQAQMDNLAVALACGLTKVGTLMFGHAATNNRYPFLGISEQHHELSHNVEASAAFPKLVTINRWFSEQLAYFMGRLAAMPEGAGSVLDNTLILVVNELAHGNWHSHQNLPFFLAGGAGGSLRMGRFLRLDRPHNDLLLTVCHAMGLTDLATFGDARYCTGPIT